MKEGRKQAEGASERVRRSSEEQEKLRLTVKLSPDERTRMDARVGTNFAPEFASYYLGYYLQNYRVQINTTNDPTFVQSDKDCT